MKPLLFIVCLFVFVSCNNSQQSAAGNNSDTTSVNRATRGTGTDLNGGTSETGTITDSLNTKKDTSSRKSNR